MKNILVSGSLAYDYVMTFPGQFEEHILPDKLHILSVMFLIDSFNKNYGGTGGNIAYTLGKIGASPVLLASIGNDGEMYKTHLHESSVSVKNISEEDEATGSAHIVTDKNNNQITAFHPGAMRGAQHTTIKNVDEDIEFVIIAPNDLSAMKRHAKEAQELDTPYVFDPGQQTTTFSSEEIKEVLEGAAFLIANDYEHELIQRKTGLTLDEIVALPNMQAVIVTLGAEGSRIITRKETVEVPGVKTDDVIDPTGAGDAYRAGFFATYVAGGSYKECAQVGGITALFAIEYHGTQNPELSRETFSSRYKDVYSTDVPF